MVAIELVPVDVVVVNVVIITAIVVSAFVVAFKIAVPVRAVAMLDVSVVVYGVLAPVAALLVIVLLASMFVKMSFNDTVYVHVDVDAKPQVKRRM